MAIAIENGKASSNGAGVKNRAPPPLSMFLWILIWLSMGIFLACLCFGVIFYAPMGSKLPPQLGVVFYPDGDQICPPIQSNIFKLCNIDNLDTWVFQQRLDLLDRGCIELWPPAAVAAMHAAARPAQILT